MSVLLSSFIEGAFNSMLADPPSPNSEELLRGSFSFPLAPDHRVEAIVFFTLRAHQLELENQHSQGISLSKVQHQRSQGALLNEFQQTFPDREFPRVSIPRNISSGSTVIQESVRDDLKAMYGAG